MRGESCWYSHESEGMMASSAKGKGSKGGVQREQR